MDASHRLMTASAGIARRTAGSLVRPRVCGILGAGLLLAASAATTIGATPCPSSPPAPLPTTPVSEADRIELFGAVWTAIDLRHVDPEHGGVDWDAIRQEFEPRIAAATTTGEVDDLLTTMVGRLGEGEAVYVPDPEVSDPTAPYTGLGISTGPVPTVEGEGLSIDHVMPDSPAERAGLHERDLILAVDGDACPTLEHGRGPAGTTVELLVRSPGEDPRTVTVERGVVVPRVVPEARLLAAASGDRIGYLRIPSLMQPDAASAVEAALQGLLEGGPLDGLVLDLRRTYGYDNELANEIAGQFLVGRQATIQGRYAAEPWAVPAGRLLEQLWDVPLRVLVDDATESAGEMLAGLLHAGGRATTVGRSTRGNAQDLQEPIDLPGGAVLYLVTRHVLLSDGTPIAPVVADVPVEAGWTDEPASADSVIAAALQGLGGD